MNKSNITRFIRGISIGLGVGLFISHNKKNTNTILLEEKTKSLIEEIKSIDYNSLKDDIVDKVDELRLKEGIKVIKSKLEVLDQELDKLKMVAKEEGLEFLTNLTKEVDKKVKLLKNTI